MSYPTSVYCLTLVTPRAQEWVKRNVATESWQWLGQRLVVSHRYVEPICLALTDAGLLLHQDWELSDG